MNRAYLVTGSESSGTCFLAQLLIDAGCAGKAGGAQPFDGPEYSVIAYPPAPQRIVAQRSIPHAESWVDMHSIVGSLRAQNYHVEMLIMVRDSFCQEQSQLKEGHATNHYQFMLNLTAAWRELFAVILGCGVDFLVVPYTSLGRTEYRRWLADEIGLGEFTTAFVDGDAKYLEAAS